MAATPTRGSRSASRCATRPAATAPSGPPRSRASTSASVESQGYCFQVDLARRAVELGYTVTEVPITFVEREAGVSKMTRGIVGEAFWRVTVWGAKTRWAQVKTVGRKAPEREG